MIRGDFIKYSKYDKLVDSSIPKKTNKEILDDMDITVIENYLREKKLLKIKKLCNKPKKR